MKATLLTMWKWVKWPVLVLVFLYSVLVGFRIFALYEKEKTAADVERIHADKLEWTDINGELPPEPDQAENNATLAGVDSNQNGIRDDVERAIYLKYKDQLTIKGQPKVVLGMLQYAKALQKEFTEVYNSETLVAVIQEEGRGALCILDTQKDKEVGELVFNTNARKIYKEQVREKFMTSYALPNKDECDLEF